MSLEGQLCMWPHDGSSSALLSWSEAAGSKRAMSELVDPKDQVQSSLQILATGHSQTLGSAVQLGIVVISKDGYAQLPGGGTGRSSVFTH